ncbi:hypothetical protein Sjap_023253 [Stephania japonica]|uniref:Secoisolariciresinol dehydrogenase n=1 Tax=Stephania japonica TaxID=461633 RepID=A0AAP0HMS8_9MAGN
MDLIHTLLNIVVPPTALFTLLCFFPPYLFFKFLLCTIKSVFSENVAGKVVLITGASSSIGEQLAYEYAKRGANLALVARREESLHEVADRARDLGSPDVTVICADVSKPEDCKRFVDETVRHFGRLDHLVNNAGINAISMFEECTDVNNFRPVMDVNFWGAVNSTHLAVPHLKESKGKIVVLASAGGWLPVPRMSFYNSSKAAVINFFEALKMELSPDIGVTVVTPGFIESEMTTGKFLTREGKLEVDQELRDLQISAFPVGQAQDCAKAIVSSVCRGDNYVTQPSWFRVLYYWQVFFPEVLQWCFHFMYVTKPGSQREALSKRIVDFTGAKYFLYPSSIQSSEIKQE